MCMGCCSGRGLPADAYRKSLPEEAEPRCACDGECNCGEGPILRSGGVTGVYRDLNAERERDEACQCVYPDKCSCSKDEDDELCHCGKTPAECAEWPQDCTLFPHATEEDEQFESCDCDWCKAEAVAGVVGEDFGVKEVLEAKLVSLTQDRDRILDAVTVLHGRTVFEMAWGLDDAEDALDDLLSDIEGEIAETVKDWLAVAQ